MKLIRPLNQLRYLKNTVHTFYGNGVRAWFIYFYYGLFRINKFRILQADLVNIVDTPIELSEVAYLIPTINDLDLLRSNKDLPREFFCDKFQKVKTCCVAKVQDELAYIHWIYFKGDFSRFLKIDASSAEINYVFTRPEFRGKNISAGAFKFTIQQLRLKGIKYLYAVVHDENVASKKSFTRAGFEDIGCTYSLGHFNLKTKV